MEFELAILLKIDERLGLLQKGLCHNFFSLIQHRLFETIKDMGTLEPSYE